MMLRTAKRVLLAQRGFVRGNALYTEAIKTGIKNFQECYGNGNLIMDRVKEDWRTPGRKKEAVAGLWRLLCEHHASRPILALGPQIRSAPVARPGLAYWKPPPPATLRSVRFGTSDTAELRTLAPPAQSLLDFVGEDVLEHVAQANGSTEFGIVIAQRASLLALLRCSSLRVHSLPRSAQSDPFEIGPLPDSGPYGPCRQLGQPFA